MTIKPEPNRHIREYLSYYLGITYAPHYAVMLSGRWGVGKTFQVKKIIGDILDRTDKRFVLISLYGLKSPSEIDDAMVAALYPWTNNDGVRIATAVGKAILKHAKIELPAIKSGDLVSRMSADVFVFDDLERCRMPVTDVLGYINQLVERDGCKVIILANENEIADAAYAAGKEKLIGKTLEVEADFDAAFSNFVAATVDRRAKVLFEKLSADIRDLHEQSAFKNLRLLQQTMWDFERFFATLDDVHRANDDAMRHLMRLFFVLSFEYKAGALSANDIAERTQRSLIDSMRKEAGPSTLAKSSEKYPGLYIYDPMLSDEVTSDVLVRGVMDAAAIGDTLNSSSWFLPANEPSWRTIWRSAERRDDDVEAAAAAMQAEFAKRKYELTGEILHLFGQMLFLADLGVSGYDRAQTVVACKAYVDDLRSQNRLEPPRQAHVDDIRHGSYGGLGFSQKDTPEFIELWNYLSTQRAEAEVAGFASDVEKLTKLMKEDATEFVREIAYGGGAGGGQYVYLPVFASADASAFADALIPLNPEAFREILIGLSSRYDMAKLAEGRELEKERPWVEQLQTALISKARDMNVFARDRITKMTDWTLGKVLQDLEGES